MPKAESLALYAFLFMVVVLAGLFLGEFAYRFFARPLSNPVPDERESSIEQRCREAGE